MGIGKVPFHPNGKFRIQFFSLPFLLLPIGARQVAGEVCHSLCSYKRYFSQQRSFLFFNPSLYLRYQPDYHWKISLYGSLHRSAGDVTDLCPFTYRTDYRTWKNTDGLFPVSIRQQYNLYGEYKNTVQEFFATATLSYRQYTTTP